MIRQKKKSCKQQTKPGTGLQVSPLTAVRPGEKGRFQSHIFIFVGNNFKYTYNYC